jgi:putative photosynthetic complex assembly protein 2
MTRYGPPVLYALFVWWFATGLALYLVRLRPWTFHWSLLGATALLVASLWGLAVSAADTSVTGAYVAFTCTVLVWGWQEIGFLTGLVTGPWRQPCPDHCSAGQRAGYAVAAILYHELALVALGVAVVAATWGGANQIGTWTFAILWVMRLSTKLNLFLGVPILNDELLPAHLRYLASFFARKAMNLLFPVSVTVSTVLLVVLLQWASALDAPESAVGYTLLAALTALAILEHWFMALPLPVAALWSWSLRAGASACPGEVDPSRR